VLALPIDAGRMTFLVTAPAEPVVDFESKRPRTDPTGTPLYSVGLVALYDGAAEVIAVKVAGSPAGLQPGQPVTVTGLVAIPWTMGERSGISYRAERVAAPVAAARSGSER
jgi:hypothetical protein